MAETGIMQLKITLQHVKPSTWRRVLVPTSIRYDQLHAVIQMLFGWTNSHLHSFAPTQLPAGQPYFEYGLVDPELDSSESTLDETEHFPYLDLEKGNLNYTYDFGEDWSHKIVLEKMVTMQEFVEADHKQIPVVLAGRGPERMEDMQDEVGEAYNTNDLNDYLAELSDGWGEVY
ncbi:plasmid pRiA4b ORF-3 family protein [Secundilactobacillus folii]|uniref:Plasmid pRiA4b Orf3-like domain-containing protein n=1 Tax=Secundilactobacillus folii TaxID=2678357 RepID=A0A7X3C2H7_9LACO|nr:plasmid pRiA4b ORF-3 family protein [Secundilactobacillus folii]MTV81497.1 hypothetical protein [Secundilactobacillus folii]